MRLAREFQKVLRAMMLLATLIVAFSCQRDDASTVNPGKVAGEVTVSEGRLFFPTKELYVSTAKDLIKMSPSEREAWGKKFNFAALGNDPTRTFVGPDIYKSILNSDNEVRVENLVTKIEGNDVVSVSVDQKDVLQVLKTNIHSKELDSYRANFKRPLSIADTAAAEANKGARVSAYKNVRTFEIGRPLPNGILYRYAVSADAYEDGTFGVIAVGNWLEYYNPDKRGWYLAGESLTRSMTNFQWSCANPQSSGTGSGGITYSGGNYFILSVFGYQTLSGSYNSTPGFTFSMNVNDAFVDANRSWAETLTFYN
jgi:hypothetical protein